MIKINLMVKPAPRFVWRRAALLLGAGAALLGLVFGGLIWWARFQALGAELESLALLEQEYRQVIGGHGALGKQEEAVGRQAKALAFLGRNQAPAGQAAILSRILTAGGPQVTISQITVSRDGEADLSGEAASFGAAIKYLGALRAIPGLTSVQERKLVTAADGKTSFVFTARIREGGTP